MSEDWQVGDVARCVDAYRPLIDGAYLGPLRPGRDYTVVEVSWDEGKNLTITPLGVGIPQANLRLLEIKNPYCRYGRYSACRFIKQPPLVKEDEVIRELELTK